MSVLYSISRIFVILVYIFDGRKQTLVDTIGILSALRMRGLHDKRHLLAKLRICASENNSAAYMECDVPLQRRLQLVEDLGEAVHEAEGSQGHLPFLLRLLPPAEGVHDVHHHRWGLLALSRRHRLQCQALPRHVLFVL